MLTPEKYFVLECIVAHFVPFDIVINCANNLFQSDNI